MKCVSRHGVWSLGVRGDDSAWQLEAGGVRIGWVRPFALALGAIICAVSAW